MIWFAVVMIVIVVVALAAALAMRRVAETDVQDAWGLTDDEAARYLRDLPRVERDIRERLPRGEFSRKQIREMAEQTTLKGVLLKRIPKDDPEP